VNHDKEVTDLLRYRLITAGLIIFIFVLIGAATAGFGGKEARVSVAYNKNNLIRLHVIANSDSPDDQSLKLKVRDRILKSSEAFLLNVENPKQAETLLHDRLDLLAGAAEDELRRYRVTQPVRVQLAEFEFPEKTYSFGVLKAGKYKGLRVVIGAGKGRNWWCVLYPPLCLLEPDAPVLKNGKQTQVKAQYKLALLENLVKRKGLTMNRFWKKWARTMGIY
jgi:stage II sporulation protein R